MTASTLRPKDYLPRVQDDALKRAVAIFGAVEVAGTMWCGKTWTSLAHGASVTRVSRRETRETVEADVQTALIGARPHVIDEWQEVPAIWDAVRDAVDDSAGAGGQFILTGSSNPRKDEVFHSGAGRIAKLRMRTMSLFETGESSGQVSLRGLFEGHFEPQLVQQGLAPLAHALCRGGWPALLGANAPRASAYIDAYLDALCDVSMAHKGFDEGETRSVLTSLARNLGGAATLDTIGADALGQSTLPASRAKRVREYLQALEGLYVVESVQGWDAPIRSRSRLRTKPKRYLADPSLAAALLAVTPERLLEDGQLFGVLFESLAVHDLAVYASALPHALPSPLRYYRDSDGLEVDVIIELRDGRWAALEIKLGANRAREAAASLTRLRRKVAANPAARNPEPTFMATIVGAGEFAYRDQESGVYVIPLACLGP